MELELVEFIVAAETYPPFLSVGHVWLGMKKVYKQFLNSLED